MSDSEETDHKTIRATEMMHSEEDVQRLTHAFKNISRTFEVEVKEALSVSPLMHELQTL